MKKLLGFFVFGFSFFFLLSLPARADLNDFIINNFHANYVIDNNVTGGSLETNEEIEVTFSDQNHGLLRAIPTNHQSYNTKLEIRGVSRDGVSEQYSTYKENGNLVLKIGDPNKTITGTHKYNVYYYQERIINFQSGQEFYWDVNGNGWDQPFEKISATVKIKQGEFSSATPICYTGYESSRESDCKFYSVDKSSAGFETTKPLTSKQGLTVGLKITGTTFIQPSFSDKLKDLLPHASWFIAGLSLSIFTFRYWLRHGKDHAGSGVFVPEYEAPKDLTPAEVGMLADYRVDGKDLSATLIDLAVRGYIKIHQETKKFLFAKSQKFSLELLKTDLSKLKEHETSLIDGVFDTKTVGEIIDVKKINKTKMASSVTAINQKVKDSLMKNYGLIDEKSNKAHAWTITIGFLVMFLSYMPFFGFAPNGLRAGIFASGVIALLFGFFMQRRTHAGQETYEKIKGLQMYMNVAEKDRLKQTQSVDRPYAEPAKTAELFEKLLPYAVALGVEKSWAKQFDGILTKQPDWVSGGNGAFTGAYLASTIGGVSTSFSRSFETSSGGASSGSSGGGGGGGGGGGW